MRAGAFGRGEALEAFAAGQPVVELAGGRADLVGLGARLEVQTVWIAGEVAWEGGQLTPGGRR